MNIFNKIHNYYKQKTNPIIFNEILTKCGKFLDAPSKADGSAFFLCMGGVKKVLSTDKNIKKCRLQISIKSQPEWLKAYINEEIALFVFNDPNSQLLLKFDITVFQILDVFPDYIYNLPLTFWVNLSEVEYE